MSILNRWFKSEKKSSFEKGIKRNHKGGLAIEPLEERQLLSVSNPSTNTPTGWNLDMDDSRVLADQEARLSFSFEGDQLDGVSRATLGFLVSATDQNLDPGQIRVMQDGQAVTPITSILNYNGTNSSLVIASVKPGEYEIMVSGQNGTVGTFQCEVFLPGDTNGDAVVSQSEYAAIGNAVNLVHERESATYITTFELMLWEAKAKAMFGTSYSQFLSDVQGGKYDLNCDGKTNSDDVNGAANPNFVASNKIKANDPNASFVDVSSLVADQDGPAVSEPDDLDSKFLIGNGDIGTTDEYYVKTFDDAISFHITDASQVPTFTIKVGDGDAVNAPCTFTFNPVTGLYETDLTLEQALLTGLGVTTIPDGDYDLNFTLTDEYGNVTDFNRVVHYVPNSAVPTVNTSAAGEKNADGYEKVGTGTAAENKAEDLDDYTGTASTFFVQVNSETTPYFKAATGTVVPGVTYAITSAGKLTVTVDTSVDPYKYLTSGSWVTDADNNVILEIPVSATDLFNAKLDTPTWANGTFKVYLTPQNDLPVAGTVTASEVENPTSDLIVSPLKASVTEEDKWDKLSLTKVSNDNETYVALESDNIVTLAVTTGTFHKNITLSLTRHDLTDQFSDKYPTTQQILHNLSIAWGDQFDYLDEDATDTFVLYYEVTDGSGATSSNSITVTVTGKNDAPTAENKPREGEDAVSVKENVTLPLDMSGYVHDADQFDSLYIYNDDVSGTWTTVTTWGTAGTEYDARIAALTAKLNAIQASGVFAADYLTFTDSDPAKGQFNPNGDFDFLGAGESVVLVYTYKATDESGTESNEATITFTVNGVNNQPVTSDKTIAINDTDDSGQVDLDLTNSATNTDVSDRDVNDTLTVLASSIALDGDVVYSSEVGLAAQPTGLAGALTWDSTNGQFVFDSSSVTATDAWGNTINYFSQLPLGATATITYKYQITDDSADRETGTNAVSAYKTVTVTITGTNQNPVATDVAVSSSTTTNENTEISVGLVTETTTSVADVDKTDTLTPNFKSAAVADTDIVAANATAIANIKAKLVALGSEGLLGLVTTTTGSTSFTFNPLKADGSSYLDFLGTDESVIITYTYTVKDNHAGESTDTTTIKIKVTGVNNNPVALTDATVALDDSDDSGTGNYDVASTTNVTDADVNDTHSVIDIAYTGIAFTDGYTLDIPETAVTVLGSALTWTDGVFTFDNSARDNLKYVDKATQEVYNFFEQLPEGVTATLSYSFKVTDNHTGKSEVKTCEITITGTNQAPVAKDNATAYEVNQNTSLTVKLIDTESDPNVHFADDVDSTDTLTATVTACVGAATGRDATGTTALTNKLAEIFGTGDGKIAYTSLFSVDGTDISFSPMNGSTGLSYFNFLGVGESVTLTVTYKVSDGHTTNSESATKTFKIKLTGVNEQPEAVNASIAIDDTDAEGTASYDLTTNKVTDIDLNDTHSVVDVAYSGITYSTTGFSLAFSEEMLAKLKAALTYDATASEFIFDNESMAVEDHFGTSYNFFSQLPAGTNATITYTFYVQDNSGDTNTEKSAQKTVTVTITGTNQNPVATVIGSGIFSTDENTAQDFKLVDEDGTYVADIDKTDTMTPSFTAASVVEGDIVAADATAIAAIRAKLTALETALGTGTYCNLITPTDASTTFRFSPLNGTASYFDFLGEGESVTITYTYNVTDNHDAASGSTTLKITVTGVNNQPAGEQKDSGANVAYDSSITASLVTSGTTGVLVTDVDVNDTHTYKQFRNYVNQSGVWTETWQNFNGTTAIDVYSASGDKFGTVQLDTAGTGLVFTPNTDYYTWKTSDLTSVPASLQVRITDSKTENSLSDAIPLTFTVTGIHQTPVVQAEQTIEIFAAGSRLIGNNPLKASISPGYSVDTATGSGWQLNGTTVTINGTDVTNSWFAVDSATGIVSFIDADAQANFRATYLSGTATDVNVTISVKVTDMKTSDSSTGLTSTVANATLHVSKQLAPTVSPTSADITGEKTENDESLTFDFADYFTVTETEGSIEHTISPWYGFAVTGVDTATSKVNETTLDAFAANIPGGLTALVTRIMSAVKVDAGATGEVASQFTLTLSDAEGKLFGFLAQGDTLSLVLNSAVNDLEYPGISTPISITLTVTGVNDVPVIHTTAANPIVILTTNDVAATNPTGTVAKGTDTFTDVDWSDTHSLAKLADNASFTGGTIGDTTYTANDFAAYFGLTVSELLDCVSITGTTVTFNINYTKDGVKVFQKLSKDVQATLNFEFSVLDNNGGTSATPLLSQIAITGTNQDPVASTLDAVTTNQNTPATIVVNTADVKKVTDIDRDDTLTVTAMSAIHNATDPKLVAKLNALTLKDYVSFTTTTGNLISGTFTPGTAFAFLGAGESVTLTYTYRASDNQGGADDTGTFQVTVTGLNDLIAVTGSAAGYTATDRVATTLSLVEGAATNANEVGFSDVDVNDTHAFYRFMDLNSKSWKEFTNEDQNVYATYDGTVQLVGTVKYGADKTRIVFTPSGDYIKWSTSDLTSGSVLLQVTLADYNAEGTRQSQSGPAQITFAVTGIHDAPEITTSEFAFVTNRTTGNSLDATTKAAAKVDAGYAMASWGLGTTMTVGTTTGVTTATYFTVNANGVLSFVSNAARTTFIATYMTGTSANEIDVTVDLTATDNGTGETAKSGTKNVTLTVYQKMAPVVEDTSIPSANENTSSVTVNLTDIIVTTPEDETVTDADGTEILKHTSNPWYTVQKYVAAGATIHVNESAVYVDGTPYTFAQFFDGSRTGVPALADLLTALQDAITVDASGNFILGLTSSSSPIFAFLAEGDHVSLVYHLNVVDQDFNVSTDTTVSLTVNGVNNVPVVGEGTEITIVADDNTTTNPTGGLTGNFTDPDWSDTHSMSNVTLAGGTIGGVDKTAAELASYFGVTVETLTACLANATGSSWEFQIAEKTFFQKLPKDVNAVLNYTFNIKDSQNTQSTQTVAATVTITGTNQAPTGLDDKIATIDLRSGTDNPTADLRTGITDIDTGETATLVGAFTATAPVIKIGDVTITTGLDLNGAVTVNANGVITIDRAKLTEGFKALVAGQTATVTWQYQVKDVHNAEAVAADGTTTTKSFTLSVVGKNENPTATDSVATLSMTAGTGAAGSVVNLLDVFTMSDPDILPTGAKDTVTLASIAGVTLAKPADGTTQTIAVYNGETGSEWLAGKVVVTWNASSVITSVNYYPIATDGNSSSENTFKWNLHASNTLDVAIPFTVKDNHGGTSGAAVCTVTVTGVFDPMEWTTPGTANVYANGNVEVIDGVNYVALDQTVSCQQELGTTYTYAVTGVTAVSTGSLATTDFKAVDDGKGKVTIYVKKDSLTDLAGLSFNVTLQHSASGSDVATQNIVMTVMAKSPIPSGNISVDLTEVTGQQITENVKDDTATGSLDFTLTDPDDATKTITAYTIEEDSATLVDVSSNNGAYTLAALQAITTSGSETLVDLINDLIPSINAAGKTFTATNQYDTFTYGSEWNISLFRFLSNHGVSDFEYLDLKFAYTISDYTVDGETYTVDSTGYVTVRINGTNDVPVGRDALYSETVPATGDQTIDVSKLVNPDDTTETGYNPWYDWDHSLSNTKYYTPKDDDIDLATLKIKNSGGNYIAIGIGKVNAVNIGDGILVWAVVNGSNEISGIGVNATAKYETLPSGETATVKVYLQVSDYAGVATTADAATVSVTVTGTYVAPSVATVVDKAGDVEGYTRTISGESVVSDGTVSYKLTGDGGLCTSSNGVYQDWALKQNDGSGTYATFDWTDYDILASAPVFKQISGDWYLVFQLISQNDYNAENPAGSKTKYAGTTMDLSAIEGLQISFSDGHSTATSNDFEVSCNQQYTVEFATVLTDVVPKRTDSGGEEVSCLPGGYYDSSDELIGAYISGSEYASKLTRTDDMTGASTVYLEVWLKDNVADYFNSPLSEDGVSLIQLQLNFSVGDTTAGVVTSVSDSASSCGYGMSSGYRGQVTVDKTGLASSGTVRFFMTFNNPSEGFNITDSEGNTVSMGMDGTAYLVARFRVTISSDYSANDLEVSVGPILETTPEISAGYKYLRATEDATTGHLEAETNQFATYYRTIKKTPVSGTVVSENIVDGGLYVRTSTSAAVDSFLSTLPDNVDAIHEWQTHYADLWLKVSDATRVTESGFTFKYDASLFTAMGFEFDSSFDGTWSVDYSAGTVTVEGSIADGYVSGDGYVHLGRVTMQATCVISDEGDILTAPTGIAWSDALSPSSLGWELSSGWYTTVGHERKDSYLGGTSSTEVWAVVYDTNDDGSVGSIDFGALGTFYGKSSLDGDLYAMLLDFNQDGYVNSIDFGALGVYYGMTQSDVVSGKKSIELPQTLLKRYLGATLNTDGDVAWVGTVLDAANEEWATALGLKSGVEVQIIVKDLGTEDLALSQIIGTDAEGNTTTGIIYLDDDALGNTWYAQLDRGVEGSTKYDLYTVLLHELGHLYGYEGHSESSEDVMSSDLAPGVRKFLTASDIALGSETAEIAAAALPDTTVNQVAETAEAALPVAEETLVLDEEGNPVAAFLLDADQNSFTLTPGVQAQLNALGLNIPDATLVPETSDTHDAAVLALFADSNEGDDEEDFDLLDFVSDEDAREIEISIDTVLGQNS